MYPLVIERMSSEEETIKIPKLNPLAWDFKQNSTGC